MNVKDYNLIEQDDKIIGKVQDLYNYLYAELEYQRKDTTIDIENFIVNVMKIKDVLINLETENSNELVMLYENVYGEITYKYIDID